MAGRIVSLACIESMSEETRSKKVEGGTPMYPSRLLSQIPSGAFYPKVVFGS